MGRILQGSGPSQNARDMANGNSQANQDLSALRNAAPARLYAGIPLSGALNSTQTGLGQLVGNGFDVFAAAAKVQTVGENPYNNWLTAEGKPQTEVYPRAMGLYIGNMGDDADGIVSALVENMLVTLKKNNSALVIQPAFTVPSGLAVDRKPSTTKDNTTVVTERFGDVQPGSLFQFPQGTIFDTTEVLKCLLTPTAALVAFLAGLTGNFPAAGTTLGIVIYGSMGLRVNTQR
jgi:hypothetical protein